MRRLLIKVIIGFLLLLTSYSLFPTPVDADKIEDLNEQIKQYEDKIKELAGQRQTLASTVNYLNSQISLTQVQISKTQAELEALEKDIENLGDRIADLNTSLDGLSQILVRHIRGTYSQSRLNDPVYLFFTSGGFTEFINRYQYLKAVQNNDKKIMKAMETSRQNYNLQKTLKEQKQEEVEKLNSLLRQQQVKLTDQQRSKQVLLEQTKNSEKIYQEKLAAAIAELTAIQGIIAGRGEESKVREVNEGERIASVLTGGPNLYACSSGAHLHFEVVKDRSNLNPFSFLSAKSLGWDNNDPPQNGSGSWNWPLNDPIRITQGYGQTSYSSIYTNNIHTGVDMVNNSNYEVKAVKKGTLYRGGINCGRGILQYVRVDHAEDEYDTYYLHVNY